MQPHFMLPVATFMVNALATKYLRKGASGSSYDFVPEPHAEECQ